MTFVKLIILTTYVLTPLKRVFQFQILVFSSSLFTGHTHPQRKAVLHRPVYGLHLLFIAKGIRVHSNTQLCCTTELTVSTHQARVTHLATIVAQKQAFISKYIPCVPARSSKETFFFNLNQETQREG